MSEKAGYKIVSGTVTIVLQQTHTDSAVEGARPEEGWVACGRARVKDGWRGADKGCRCIFAGSILSSILSRLL